MGPHPAAIDQIDDVDVYFGSDGLFNPHVKKLALSILDDNSGQIFWGAGTG